MSAKNQLSRLVRAAQAGEEVVIAQRGIPAVRLVPVDALHLAVTLQHGCVALLTNDNRPEQVNPDLSCLSITAAP